MGRDKFIKQIKKNSKTSTDAITEELYNSLEDAPSNEAGEAEPVNNDNKPADNDDKSYQPESLTEAAPNLEADSNIPVARKSAGRPKGDDTVRKTIYIPQYNWPYVQAAVKYHDGNLQKYFNGLIQDDIDRHREKYRELAELYRSIDESL